MQQSVHIIYPQNDSLILIEREIYEQRCQFWKSKEQNCSSIWRLKSSCIFRFIEEEFSDHLMKRRTNVIKLLSFLILLNLKKNVLLSHQIMYQGNTNQNPYKTIGWNDIDPLWLSPNVAVPQPFEWFLASLYEESSAKFTYIISMCIVFYSFFSFLLLKYEFVYTTKF